MAICEVCGKKLMVGNNVSHAKNRTKRQFNANIQKIRIQDGKTARKADVCTRCIKGNKITKAV